VEIQTFEQRKRIINAWLQVLTSPKTLYKWNEEKAILHLIGICAKCAIIFDPNGLFDSLELLTSRYKVKIKNISKNIYFSKDNLSTLERNQPWTALLVFFSQPSYFNWHNKFWHFSLGNLFTTSRRAKSISRIL
jgi:hypothetical protein